MYLEISQNVYSWSNLLKLDSYFVGSGAYIKLSIYSVMSDFFPLNLYQTVITQHLRFKLYFFRYKMA